MKKYNGFTLIELLAVIVILALIALIAVPIIMGVISDSKSGTAKDCVYGYVKAVELDAANQVTELAETMSGTYSTKNGSLYQSTTKVLDVNYKGTTPENGGTVVIKNGHVTSAVLTFDGIKTSYDGSEATIKK